MATLYKQVLLEKGRLEKKKEAIYSQVKKLPEGKIFCKGNGKYYKWFTYENGNPVYIPKKSRAIAETLALRKYLLVKLSDLEHMENAIDAFLKKYPKGKLKAEKMLEDMVGYQDILAPFFKIKSKELEEWKNAEYRKSKKYPERLTHKTASGNLVRSKSEAMIDTVLYTNHIPFRYECEVTFGESVFFPDFLIRHPKTGELYIWEHFGMMDDPTYIEKAFAKLKIYAQNGFIPTINLIVTYETMEHPLSMLEIEECVEKYFLN